MFVSFQWAFWPFVTIRRLCRASSCSKMPTTKNPGSQFAEPSLFPFPASAKRAARLISILRPHLRKEQEIGRKPKKSNGWTSRHT